MEELALIQLGCLFDNPMPREGTYSRECLLEGNTSQRITILNFKLIFSSKWIKFMVVQTWQVHFSLTFPGFPDKNFKISTTFLPDNFRF